MVHLMKFKVDDKIVAIHYDSQITFLLGYTGTIIDYKPEKNDYWVRWDVYPAHSYIYDCAYIENNYVLYDSPEGIWARL